MVNMSYCRFHNTASALKECFEDVMEAIDEGMTLQQFRESLSSDESYSFDRLMALVEDMVEAKDQFEYNEGMKDIA